MSSQRADKYTHFNELYASAYMALKMASMILLTAWGSAAGAEYLAAVCIVLALAYKGLDGLLAIKDNGWFALLGAGFLAAAVHLFASPFGPAMLAVSLGIVFLFYLLYSIKVQPFANLYAKVEGVPALREQHTWLWLVTLGGLLIASAVLSAEFTRWIALCLALSAPAAHVYLQYFARGKHWHPSSSRQLSDFRFVRVPGDAEHLKPIYELFVKELVPILGPEIIGTRSEADIVASKMKADVASWKHTVFFAAYHQERMIGTMACQFDQRDDRLPFEKTTLFQANLDGIRDIGGVSEFGKFCVEEDYRLNPEIFAGLLLCATEEILTRHIPFIVVQAVLKTARIYTKMGFTQLTKEPAAHFENGLKVHLLVKNLAVDDQTPNRLTGNLEEHFSPYVIYRFVWRQILGTVIATALGKKSAATVPPQALTTLAVLH